MKQERGFSIMEYVVSMALLLIIFTIAFEVFVPVAKSGKVESGNIQSQIEGLIGLELFRRDIVSAGVGLPWSYPAGFTYSEAASTEDPWKWYNDDGTGEVVGSNHNTTIASQPPRPIIATDGQLSGHLPPSDWVVGSDILTIKSAGVADLYQASSGPVFKNNTAIDKWTMLSSTASNVPQLRIWGGNRDPGNTDRVIVLQPANTQGSFMLGLSGTNFDTTTTALTSFQPGNTQDAYYVYALHDDQAGAVTSLNFPFNRADYYVSTDPAIVPKRCAAGTGVLVKRILDHQNQTEDDPLPLLDCVADFQIVLGVDNADNALSQRNCLTNPTGDHMFDVRLFFNSATTTPNSAQIRSSYKEIRLYILAQEGSYDRDYTYTEFTKYSSDSLAAGKVVVGEDNPNDCDPGGSSSCDCAQDGGDEKLGRLFDLAANVPTYSHYRWKIYRMTIKPEGLATSTTTE